MKCFRLVIPLLGMALALSACGHTTGDRALSGAGTGALTSPDQIDLGRPAWK